MLFFFFQNSSSQMHSDTRAIIGLHSRRRSHCERICASTWGPPADNSPHALTSTQSLLAFYSSGKKIHQCWFIGVYRALGDPCRRFPIWRKQPPVARHWEASASYWFKWWVGWRRGWIIDAIFKNSYACVVLEDGDETQVAAFVVISQTKYVACWEKSTNERINIKCNIVAGFGWLSPAHILPSVLWWSCSSSQPVH